MIKAFRLFVAVCLAIMFIFVEASAQANPPTTKLKDEMRMPWQRLDSGYIRHWLLLGEFPNPDRAALDVDFLKENGGEARIRPVAGMKQARPDGSDA